MMRGKNAAVAGSDRDAAQQLLKAIGAAKQ